MAEYLLFENSFRVRVKMRLEVLNRWHSAHSSHKEPWALMVIVTISSIEL